MKRLTVFSLAWLTAFALFGAGSARAEMVNFGYSWSVQPSSVFPGGTGSVTLAATPDATSAVDTLASSPVMIPGAVVTTTSSATDVPDSFNTAFSMKLTLTDTASGQTDNLTFAGMLVGTLTATSSNLEVTFSAPVSQEVTLGAFRYTVMINPGVVPLPVPGGATPAQIGALIQAAPAAGTPVTETPEPTSLALGGMALAAFGAFVRRRRVAA